jgi:hypothetical protein
MVEGDGQETAIQAGPGYHIPPGHDAWTSGYEGVVCVEFDQAVLYRDRETERQLDREAYFSHAPAALPWHVSPEPTSPIIYGLVG